MYIHKIITNTLFRRIFHFFFSSTIIQSHIQTIIQSNLSSKNQNSCTTQTSPSGLTSLAFADGTRTLSSCTIDDDIEDGFVLVSLHNRAEHPKYASVAGHRLSMPQLEFQLDELRLECTNEVQVEVSFVYVRATIIDALVISE